MKSFNNTFTLLLTRNFYANSIMAEKLLIYTDSPLILFNKRLSTRSYLIKQKTTLITTFCSKGVFIKTRLFRRSSILIILLLRNQNSLVKWNLICLKSI